MTNNKFQAALVSAALILGVAAYQPLFAQGQEQGMAMTLLPVMHEGSQSFIITPRGFKVEVPGTGLSRDARQVAVYQDPQQNYWYINKHGEPTQVPPPVMQSVYAQVQAQMNARTGQATPAGSAQAPVQQTTVVEQPQNGNGVGTALLGTAGAFAGAATGAALVNSSQYYNHPYYGVPYGTPVYRGGVQNSGNNSYYYYNNGQKQYINADNNNSRLFSQFDKQGNWTERDQWSKNLQSDTALGGQGGRRGLMGGNREGSLRGERAGGFRRRGR